MTTTVTAKGQVTIPKAVRELLGISPGSSVDFVRAPDGRIVLVRADKKQPLTRMSRVEQIKLARRCVDILGGGYDAALTQLCKMIRTASR